MNQDIEAIVEKRDEKEKILIIKAFKFAKQAHKDQKRFSGDDYIVHPVAVAKYLNSLALDADSIASALLHDVVEDTKTSLVEIKQEFGVTICGMVDAVSKLSTVRLTKSRIRDIAIDEDEDMHSPYMFERQLGILRKMFLAMAQDLRVVLIKLSDRLHNMQTLQYVKEENQKRIALETLEIYAPLAHRLGMGQLKGELEDLAFPYAYPEQYKNFKLVLGDSIALHEEHILKIKSELSDALNLFKIKHTIDGRVKHFYSLYKKITKSNYNLDQIYDLVACRVMVNTIEECYMSLGIVHQLWKPLKGTIKDYIAVPKPNGYRSIHTTVFGPNGRITEIQIRTWQMHEQAERGVAAHWHYTSQIVKSENNPENFYAPKDETVWVKKMTELYEGLTNKTISPEEARIDFFHDRIFVFTPHGDVHEMPLGSTPIDFAYCVHSDIGNAMVGAKVNGKLINISTALQNGDMVEILTSKKSKPKKDWLKFVKTSHAKTVIKHTLKEE